MVSLYLYGLLMLTDIAGNGNHFFNAEGTFLTVVVGLSVTVNFLKFLFSICSEISKYCKRRIRL